MTKTEVEQLFTDDVEERRNKIREFIMDETNPYEDREYIWLNTPDHLMTIDSCIIQLSDFERGHGEISWYDDFYWDRYQTCDLRNAIGKSHLDDEQKRDDFIANCMRLGVHGFVNDW